MAAYFVVTRRRKAVGSFLLSTAARDPSLIASLAKALCLMARCARCVVRREAAVFVGSDETTVSENQLVSMRFVGASCRSAARTSIRADRAAESEKVA